MKKIILLVLIALVTMGAKAYDFSVDGVYYNVIDKSGKVVEVTKGDAKYSGSVTIPATVSSDGVTYTVSRVGNQAFDGCDNLESVTLGANIESINSYAFYKCTNLSQINLNDKIVTFGNDAFCGCTSLTSVVVGSSVDNMDSGVFAGCTNLKTVEIHNGASVIGGSAFKGCMKLTTVTIPNSVLTIGGSAFADCVSLTEVKIGDGVQTVPNQAFDGCTRLNTVSLGSSVTLVGSYAFYNCNGMSSFTVLNPSVPKVENNAFTDYSAKLYVPSQSTSSYNSHEIWKKFGAVKDYDSKVYLTIRQATEGAVKMLTNVGERYSYDIIPASGWEIHSVTFNNEDVTKQLVGNNYTTPAMTSNGTLSIVFVEEGSGVRSATARDVRVTTDDSGNIIVNEAPYGETISVYSTNGILLRQVPADGGRTSINMNAHGIYIVKVGDMTAKLSL